MSYFNGFDSYGNSYRVEEYGNDIGMVVIGVGKLKAVRLAPSTYMGTNGQVYAANQNNCSVYSSPQWVNWARNKMYSLGFLPEF